MKLVRYSLLLVLVLCFAPRAVSAYHYENPQGPYWTGWGAFTATTDVNYLATSDETFIFHHQFGWAAGTSLGFQHRLGFRIEAEFCFHYADFDRVTIEGVDNPTGGQYKITSLYVNLFYEAEMLFICAPIRPYIGIGRGISNVSVYHRRENTLIDDSDDTKSLQAILGIGYPLSQELMVSAEYRLITIDEPALDGGTGIFLAGRKKIFINQVGVSVKWVLC